jgi:hypothetical protein
MNLLEHLDKGAQLVEFLLARLAAIFATTCEETAQNRASKHKKPSNARGRCQKKTI